VFGAACIAEGTVVVKLFPRSDPFATNAIGMTTGALLLLVLSLFRHEHWGLPEKAATWLATIYLVLLGSVVAFYLFLYVLSHWTASAVSYQFVMFPFVTVLVAGWLAGETINSWFLIGAALVLGGVWLGAFSRRFAPGPSSE
jgi:drug/metabolite transporter (DMT)-like permease